MNSNDEVDTSMESLTPPPPPPLSSTDTDLSINAPDNEDVNDMDNEEEDEEVNDMDNEEEEDDDDDDDDEDLISDDDDAMTGDEGEDDEENPPASAISSDDPISKSLFADFDDDSDSESDDDENYLQKIDETTQQKIISEYHPELQTHNYDEISAMARVVRDANGVIVDPLHRTLPFITRYEKAKILGERAKQINAGAIPFVSVDQSVIDGYLIALKEFEEKKIPFIVKRPMPNGGCEYWKLADLEILV